MTSNEQAMAVQVVRMIRRRLEDLTRRAHILSNSTSVSLDNVCDRVEILLDDEKFVEETFSSVGADTNNENVRTMMLRELKTIEYEFESLETAVKNARTRISLAREAIHVKPRG